MTQLRAIIPLLALAALPACIVPIPVPEGTPGAFEIVLDPGDSCGARGLQDFVGQDESAVTSTTFASPGPVRVVRPGSVVAADSNPQRVNFRTDATGKVVAVDCG
ncbi:I78 family peptidase inhibitor [Rubellimicrobium arenae]|uniref:I78 family peptidase inhibitor n=1 Tax=Rubellimicrobium arenae TaxID=2817372 RepID=UPI001B30668C|nr:I78 family peptidase inhibitor [Rubellimicrobium arenae]